MDLSSLKDQLAAEIVRVEGIYAQCIDILVMKKIEDVPPVVVDIKARLERALRASAYLDLYRDAAARYQLGYEVRRVARVELPGYEGPSDFDHARAVR